eukprot:TRINITY_DN1478_c0_g1_i1.p1 TRINITY_DN1478_c0_g1~~TRINITY_DN1478_c0_g1_i1.p1  ORF type:complete len:263 (+),score=46.86 TRINITY_DN1478_c0_g1_i1:52-840(+)
MWSKIFKSAASAPRKDEVKSAETSSAKPANSFVMDEETGNEISLPTISPQSKLHIVFDLNGTLLSYHFLNSLMFDSKLAQRTGDRIVQSRSELIEHREPAMWGQSLSVRFRPYLDELLDFLFSPEMSDKVVVGAWTFSGKGQPARELAELAFGKYYDRLAFVWDGSKSRGKNRSRKNLEDVWSEFPDWNAENTILVDDSPSKIVQPDNAYVIPTYHFVMALNHASAMMDGDDAPVVQDDEVSGVQLDKELLNLMNFVKSKLL